MDNNPSTPFCWQAKAALRHIRTSFDATDGVASALVVYIALTEIASDKGAEEFQTTHAWIAGLSGLSRRTVQNRIPQLVEIGLIEVKTAALKSPSTYRLLPFGNGCATSSNGCRAMRNECATLRKPTPQNMRNGCAHQKKEEQKKEAPRKLGTADRIGLEHQAELLREKISGLESDGFYEHDRTPGWKTKLDDLKAKLEGVESQLLGGIA